MAPIRPPFAACLRTRSWTATSSRRFVEAGIPPGKITMSHSSPDASARRRSAVMGIAWDPRTGFAPTASVATSNPARRRTSTMVTASISSKPLARRTQILAMAGSYLLWNSRHRGQASCRRARRHGARGRGITGHPGLLAAPYTFLNPHPRGLRYRFMDPSVQAPPDSPRKSRTSKPLLPEGLSRLKPGELLVNELYVSIQGESTYADRKSTRLNS